MNLYIAGTANVPLFSQQSIFKNDFINGLPTGIKPYMTVILILVLTIICKILLDLYMQTKSGYLLRAVGDNHVLVTSLAKDQGNVKILGLAISNGLVSLAGCVFGTSIFKKISFVKTTTAVLVGSIIYKACVAVAIRNFEPQAMKLITAILFLVVLVISMGGKKKVKGNA